MWNLFFFLSCLVLFFSSSLLSLACSWHEGMLGIWVIGSKTNTKMVNKGSRQEKLRNVMTEAHDPAILAAIGNKTPRHDRCCRRSESKLSRSCGIPEFQNSYARVQAFDRDGFKFTNSSVNTLHEIWCRICYFCGFLQLSAFKSPRFCLLTRFKAA